MYLSHGLYLSLSAVYNFTQYLNVDIGQVETQSFRNDSSSIYVYFMKLAKKNYNNIFILFQIRAKAFDGVNRM